MNYINRQKKESYPSRTIAGVWDQYEDYLSMAMDLGKHMMMLWCTSKRIEAPT